MTNHIADDHAALLDYLYEEGEPAERLKIARHLQECATCTVTALELQSVRGMLGDWTPPPVSLGLRFGNDEIAGRSEVLPELPKLPKADATRVSSLLVEKRYPHLSTASCTAANCSHSIIRTP